MMSINIKIDEFNYDTDSLMIVNQNIILENGIYVLVGENGIGKTTFLNILAGNFKAKLNVILNNSKLDIYNNKNIIFLKEEFLGLEYLKACEVIDYFLIIYGKEKSYHFVEKMMNIARFDENFLNKMIINLSKGTRQKLIFIIYMILDLDVIIFDESLENIEEEAFHSIIDRKSVV